jgi:hypothetical protein
MDVLFALDIRMSRSIPSSSWRDANDYASGSRNTNFKPLVLGEIQAGGDR